MSDRSKWTPASPVPDGFQYIDDITVSHHCSANTFNPDTQHYDGPRCRSWVKPGQKVCKRHGGNVPWVRTKAELRGNEIQIAARARKRLSNNGAIAIEDVYAALEKNQAHAQVFLEICQERIDELLAKGEQFGYKSTAGEQLKTDVALYERAMDRVHRYMVDYVKLGIADRRVKVQEAQAVMLVTVIQNILDRLDLSRDQRRAANIVAKEELRAIAGQQE